MPSTTIITATASTPTPTTTMKNPEFYTLDPKNLHTDQTSSSLSAILTPPSISEHLQYHHHHHNHHFQDLNCHGNDPNVIVENNLSQQHFDTIDSNQNADDDDHDQQIEQCRSFPTPPPPPPQLSPLHNSETTTTKTAKMEMIS